MVVDVTDQFKDCLKAEQDGKNVLILRELDTPRRRFDGKRAILQLEHRWLSDPDSLVSVQGNDFTLWQKKEINPKQSLFEQVDLF